MIVPSRRGVRRLLRAAVVGVATGIVLSIAGPGVAGYAQAEPTDPPPTPTDLPATTEPPPPPPPVPGVKVDAADLTLSPSYWQGPGTRGTVVVRVTNTGDSPESVTLTYTLPPGVHDAGTPCPCTATLKAGDVWTVDVLLAVDPDAWRRAPLAGIAVAVATVVSRPDLGARDQDGYSIVLPPGPPVPGVLLVASDIFLPSIAPARQETAALRVKLANTGSVPVSAAIELITPDGVTIASFPPGCLSHTRVAAHRDRCELGRLDPGTDRTLAFNLSISALARGEAPISGAVHGYVTPSGQDTVEVQMGYRIIVPAPAGQSPVP
jgi:hypothetical protein